MASELPSRRFLFTASENGGRGNAVTLTSGSKGDTPANELLLRLVHGLSTEDRESWSRFLKLRLGDGVLGKLLKELENIDGSR